MGGPQLPHPQIQKPAHQPGVGWQIVSICGSAASLTALVVVIVDKIAAATPIDPQFLLWRIVLAFMALVGVGATLGMTYEYILRTWTPEYTARQRIVRCSLAGLLGLLGFGIGLDGFFASVYWHRWLGVIVQFIRYFTSGS